MTKLSVVIPATNQPLTLDRCLTAIDRAADGPDEVVVVDGPAELSASAARNVGVRRATGDVVVFVDSDVEVHADTFTRLRAALDGAGAPSAVFGSYDDTPDHPGVVSRFRNLLHHHVHQHGAGPAESFWTGLGAVEREVFLAVGGFDEERYPHPSVEDIDLGARLVAHGARVELDPSIQGTHLKEWTLRSMLFTDLFRRGIPWVALQIRSGRPTSTLNCGWRHRASAVAVLGLLLAAASWQPVLVAAAVAAFVGLNVGFYGLLVRQLGLLHGATGVVLHGLHHLVAVLAVPLGVAVAVVAAAAALRGDDGVPVPSPAGT